MSETSPGFLKYFGQQDAELYGGREITGRTQDGVPLFGNWPAPLVKQHEMDSTPIVFNFRARMFCLWKEKDFEFFCKVMDHTVNGEFMLLRRKDLDPEKPPELNGEQHFKVWLEWTEQEARPPVISLSGGEP